MLSSCPSTAACKSKPAMIRRTPPQNLAGIVTPGRPSKRSHHSALTLILGLLIGSVVAHSQSRSLVDSTDANREDSALRKSSETVDVPDAPIPSGKAALNGTIVDPNGGVIEAAEISLTDATGAEVRTGRSGANGQFSFSGLAAGTYKLTVSANGMGTFVNAEINLKADEIQTLPVVILTVATTRTDVQVVATRDEIAQEQLNFQMEQRVFGVLPNFYTSYLWDAQPLTVRQKFQLAIHSITDPTAFVGYAFLAGIQQANDTYPAYHQGAEGYGKRYGADFANDTAGRLLGSAIYPSLFRQDPRYFYKGKGSKGSRAFYAISQAFVCRGDNGHQEINFSHILGTFSAVALANVYHPAADRTLSITLTTGLIQTAGNAANNLVREFLFKGITPKVPDYAK